MSNTLITSRQLAVLAAPHMTSPVVDSGGITVTGASNIGSATMYGNLTFSADNTLDIGASGATRPRNLYVAGISVIGAGMTITAGGLVITAGGLRVTAGNVGIGVAPIPQFGLYLQSSLTGSTSQKGMYVGPTGDSGATTTIIGIEAQPITAAAAFTCASVSSFHAYGPVKGSGSTITSAYGLLVDSVTSGNTNNYGIYVGAPSGGSGDNQSLHTMGPVEFASSSLRWSTNTNFAAGDKYLVIDTNGYIHKSSIGPAS